MLDSSDSVGYTNWRMVLRNVNIFIHEIAIGEYDNHVGVITYGTTAAVEIYLDDYLVQRSLKSAVARLRWKNFDTNTAGN